jgi:hypothetical protein
MAAAAAFIHRSDPYDEAIEALQALYEKCENLLVENMGSFEVDFTRTREALNLYRKSLPPSDQITRAFTAAMMQFTTQAQTLIAYFHRHDDSSRASPFDGKRYLEGFREFQLATFTEIGKLQTFLLTLHTFPPIPEPNSGGYDIGSP